MLVLTSSPPLPSPPLPSPPARQELLSASRLRYHELLTAGVALRVGRALAADGLVGGLVVTGEAQAAELVGRLGLPAVLEGYGAGAC